MKLFFFHQFDCLYTVYQQLYQQLLTIYNKFATKHLGALFDGAPLGLKGVATQRLLLFVLPTPHVLQPTTSTRNINLD